MSAQLAVAVSQLHKRYGRVTAVERLDLEVERGSIYGLLGPNGAGKTTTFGILCGFLSATSGRAEVLGTPVEQLYRLRGKVAALPQDSQFPAQVPVGEQLNHFGRLMGLSGAEAARETARVLEAIGLPQVTSMRGDQLSHGMAKRVGLAQAMIGPPELVFLDEPTAGLDPRSAHQVKRLIAELSPRTTVVLSSHNLVDVQAICSHGTVIQHGRVVATGTMESLTRSGNQVTFELAPGATPPVDALRRSYGEAAVILKRGQDNQHRQDGQDSQTNPNTVSLTVVFGAEHKVTDVIGHVLQQLLQHDVPILGVTRGTSLETAFLEATADAKTQPAAAPPAGAATEGESRAAVDAE